MFLNERIDGNSDKLIKVTEMGRHFLNWHLEKLSLVTEYGDGLSLDFTRGFHGF